jgi:hypothetical protein
MPVVSWFLFYYSFLLTDGLILDNRSMPIAQCDRKPMYWQISEQVFSNSINTQWGHQSAPCCDSCLGALHWRAQPRTHHMAHSDPLNTLQENCKTIHDLSRQARDGCIARCPQPRQPTRSAGLYLVAFFVQLGSPGKRSGKPYYRGSGPRCPSIGHTPGKRR